MFNKRKHTDEEIKMLNAKAYQNGFRDGMSLDEKYPQTLSFMGVGLEKLTEIVSKYLDEEFYAKPQWTDGELKTLKERQREININTIKEKKMTREEAEKNLAKLGTPRDMDGKYYILTVLEALSLIKFDEPPKREYIFFPNPDAGKDNLSVYQDDAVNTLKKYGYQIYDKQGNKL